MSKKRLLSLSKLTAMAVCCGSAYGMCGIAQAQVTINRIEARLFYDEKGIFSKPIAPDMNLWNTVIGEGDSGGASNATLIDVVLNNTTSDYQQTSIAIKVTDTDTKKVLLQKNAKVGVMRGQFHYPILLSDTGCSPLLVTANVMGSSQSKKLEIPFQCGE